MSLLLDVVPDAACVLLCAAAAAIDARRYLIPNWLTGAGLALGLVMNPILGLAVGGGELGLARAGLALAGAGTLLLALAPLGALRLVGLGDVKLLVAAGALVRWPLAPVLLLHVALAGGALALLVALRRGILPALFRAPGSLTEPSPGRRMPYGLAIAAGALWAVLARHVDALSLLPRSG